MICTASAKVRVIFEIISVDQDGAVRVRYTLYSDDKVKKTGEHVMMSAANLEVTYDLSVTAGG